MGGGDAALHRLFDEYFEAHLQRDPLLATSIGDPRYDDRLVVSIDPKERALDEKLERDALATLATIDRARLSESDQLLYDVFKAGRESEAAGFAFPEHLMPVNQFSGMTISFAQLGAGTGIQPFKTVRDYERFLARVDGFVRWIDQAIVNMKEGVERGYTIPRILAEKTLPQLGAHIVERAEASIFWGPIERLPSSFSADDRERLTAAYREAITEKLVPAYRKLRDFMRDEYTPRCRTTVGLDALPDGKAWYAYRVRRLTTTPRTPTEIHSLGLREVERIHAEMDRVQAQIGFRGTRAELFRYLDSDSRFFFEDRAALIAGYVALKARVNAQLPRLFELAPKANYEVRAVEPFRERSAPGGQYQSASRDGARPAIFYANAYDLRARPKWAMEALSLHEANPGHHFQISIQREQQALPPFRRFESYTAFIEGWGLYAESLGEELGLYTDPYQAFGRLEGELWRAIRLVVDTGLHDRGWTREQVLAYMERESPVAEAARVAEAERYMAIPGQALAYKLGQLKIRELRKRAEQALGARFDVRRFHTAVLIDGALPLDLLDAKLDRWIAKEKR